MLPDSHVDGKTWMNSKTVMKFVENASGSVLEHLGQLVLRAVFFEMV